MTRAAYLDLLADGRLAARAEAAVARLSPCVLCARRCGADRHAGGRKASCRIGRLARVHAIGRGRILFAGCSLHCLHCPEAAAAWEGKGDDVTADALADILLGLQGQGGPAIVLDSPGHVAAQIVEAVALAAGRGLTAPLAWRSAGFESAEALALLDGVVDLYMPEVKFGDDQVARVVAGIRDYGAASRAALAEMHRQVGPLRRDTAGRPLRGLLVRHRVLPGGLAGTAAALARLPPGTAVRISGGYTPVHRADRHPVLARPLGPDDVAAARRVVRELGLVEV